MRCRGRRTAEPYRAAAAQRRRPAERGSSRLHRRVSPLADDVAGAVRRRLDPQSACPAVRREMERAEVHEVRAREIQWPGAKRRPGAAAVLLALRIEMADEPGRRHFRIERAGLRPRPPARTTVYRTNRPSFPIIARSTNFEALWLFAENDTPKPPRSRFVMPSIAATKRSRERSLPARRRPSVNTFAARKPSSELKFTSKSFDRFPRSRYSLTTGVSGLHGYGTTCEIVTPCPSLPSASASALLPTNDTV